MASNGKYDAEAETLAALTQARATIVVVIDGAKGTGFSITMVDPDVALCTVLASVLREVAARMDENARLGRIARQN